MAAHHAQFSPLLFELQTQIYDIALDKTPRNVEVEVRDDRVVSRTRPPALLHVHRDSRAFVQKTSKLRLPRFADSAARAPYAPLLAKYRLSKTAGRKAVSCLHDVFFDMERDTLVCRGRSKCGMTPRPLYLFGRIEECCLRQWAVNIDGWLKFPLMVEELRKAKHLDTLLLFQDQTSSGMLYKVGRIQDGLKSAEKDRLKAKVRVPNYVAPSVRKATTSNFVPSRVQIPKPRKGHGRGRLLTPLVEPIIKTPTWTTYKYLARSFHTLTRPFIDAQLHPKPKLSSRKRRADTDLKAVFTGETRLSERAKRIKMWTKEQRRERLEAQSRPVPSKPIVLTSTKHEWAGFEPQFSNRASPSTTGASSRSPRSESTSSRQSQEPPYDTESVLDESAGNDGEDSDASDSESEGSKSDSPDPQDEEEAYPERRPRLLHAHRFNFDVSDTEVLVEWEDSPEMDSWEWVAKAELLHDVPVMIAAFIANNEALEVGTPVRFHERNSGSVGFDFLVEFEGYPEEIYWTWVPESKMQIRVPNMVEEWMSENASVVEAARDEETIDEQILAEQNYAENVRTDEVEEKDEDEPAAEADAKKENAGAAEVENAGGEESSAEYTPKRFVAQRDTPDGQEILVEWEGYPYEKDWTWEPLSNLLEDTPDMVKAWKTSRKAKKVFKVYEVDSILNKRKVGGEWHYEVRWKGFSKDEATSMEPCEKLRVDVPELVETFEARKPKRGRPKKVKTA
jgi:hypothetical protein